MTTFDIIIWSIIPVLQGILIILRFLPDIVIDVERKGRWFEPSGMAYNTAFFIVMHTDIDGYKATLLQEKYERRQKWFLPYLWWIAFSRLNPDGPLWLLGFLIEMAKESDRQLEYRGHEITMQYEIIRRGKNPYRTRIQEATDMHNGYNGLFKNLTPKEIYANMTLNTNFAKQWVLDNE